MIPLYNREFHICYYVMDRIVCNPVEDIMLVVAIFRLYLGVRVLIHLSKWSNSHSQEIRDLYLIPINYKFALKCIFQTRPFVFLFTFILLMAIISAFAMRIFERAYYTTAPIIDKTDTANFQDFHNFWNVLWLSIVTITTVGFGDLYCKSHFGRMLSCVVSIIGVLTISLMLVSLENTTKFNQFQALSYEYLYRIMNKEQVRQLASTMITHMFRIKQKQRIIFELTLQKGHINERQKIQQEIAQIKNQINCVKIQFKKSRLAYSADIEWPLEESLRQLQFKIEIDIQEIKKQVEINKHQLKLLMKIKYHQGLMNGSIAMSKKYLVDTMKFLKIPVEKESPFFPNQKIKEVSVSQCYTPSLEGSPKGNRLDEKIKDFNGEPNFEFKINPIQLGRRKTSVSPFQEYFSSSSSENSTSRQGN